MCKKFCLLFLHLLIFLHSSVSTVHLLSILYINTSQDTEIAKYITENWQGDFKNYLFISVVVWKIFLVTAGWVWFSEIQNLIKYSWANLPPNNVVPCSNDHWFQHDLHNLLTDNNRCVRFRGRRSTRVPGYSSSFIITRLDNSVTATR